MPSEIAYDAQCGGDNLRPLASDSLKKPPHHGSIIAEREHIANLEQSAYE
jgi:hypothetical protein